MPDSERKRTCETLHTTPELILLIRGTRAALWRISTARSTVKASVLRQMAHDALLIPQRLVRVTNEMEAARAILDRGDFILNDNDFATVKHAMSKRKRREEQSL